MRLGRVVAIVALIAAVTATSACSGQPKTTGKGSPSSSHSATAGPTTTSAATPECPTTPLNVAITYTLTKDSSGGVVVDATTNLPDGTSVQASFFAEEQGFLAQDQQDVTAGTLKFGPFADHGSPLHGAYEFSITAAIARNQPQGVRECIGEAGELMAGPLVKVENITGDKYAAVDESVVLD